MKNIHLIPTDKPSRLHLIENALTITSEYKNSVCDSEVNIYITNDEVPKDGEWCIFGESGLTQYCSDYSKKMYRKIILTDNQDLIKDGVQAIDDEFLEWFVKNPSCEEVDVKPMLSNNGRVFYGYKIFIPKEEPNPFELPKALPDDVFYESLEPKQETLEESFSRYENEKYHSPTQGSIPDLESAKFGAKWQQERMYSEEEVLELLNKREDYINSEDNIFEYQSNKEWFKQFKKK